MFFNPWMRFLAFFILLYDTCKRGIKEFLYFCIKIHIYYAGRKYSLLQQLHLRRGTGQ